MGALSRSPPDMGVGLRAGLKDGEQEGREQGGTGGRTGGGAVETLIWGWTQNAVSTVRPGDKETFWYVWEGAGRRVWRAQASVSNAIRLKPVTLLSGLSPHRYCLACILATSKVSSLFSLLW